MRFKGPLAGSYAAAAGLVVAALVPFLMLSAAVVPLAHELGRSIGAGQTALDLTFSLAYGAYAFGTVMAVQFAVHLPQRRMLLVYVTLFVLAAALAAWAPGAWAFFVAFVLDGLCTSLMLIAAVPPLVTGWPPAKMPWTGLIMNLCVFGAVAVGPTLGALQLGAGGWRPLFWTVTAIAVVALVLSVLTFEDQGPQDTGAPWDWVAIGLAGTGCAAAFFGAGYLQATKAPGALQVAPLVVGAAMVLALVVFEYRSPRPLMPVRQLASTKPTMGVLIAMAASSSAFGLMELLLAALAHKPPATVALLFLPEFGAAVLTAVVFGLLFRTRYTPVLAIGGMSPLAVAAALIASGAARSGAVVALATGLIGLGVGASVSPALFIAGFSLRSSQIQRVFALIELLRGVTAFLVAPVLVFLVSAFSPNKSAGTRDAAWICLAIAVAGGLGAFGLFVSGRARLEVPDLARWQGGDAAWESPPLPGKSRREVRREPESAPPHRFQATRQG